MTPYSARTSATAWLSTWDRNVRAGVASDVPCGTCTACCKGWSVALHESEDPTLYDTDGLDSRGNHRLRRQENGDCAHLVDGKCTCYANRPRTCRLFDCRCYLIAGNPPSKDGELTAIGQAAVHQWRTSIGFKTDEDFVTFIAVRMGAGIAEEIGLKTVGEIAGYALSHVWEHKEDAERAWQDIKRKAITDPATYRSIVESIRNGD